ncbi:hypothetical protein [Anaerosacchariphilus polymeriproducens]|uniref:Lipocalin-like domain-containing protein n=1 Tax=Anaerosacchariphilus polymeriproducens TaxID=1812858 RepID=A0A371AW23_9FIRM|nr:hypothetical protein [Anaerosacchariphilus polymeriproducens]RDU23739.1 hypothetical protein DWV06_07730 [Anaerosacchariphilus polymeriproducens]
MKRKELKFLFAGIFVSIGFMALLNCWLDKRAKKESFADGIESENNFIIGKWKATAVEVNGQRMKVNETTNSSLIITLKINNGYEATINYEGNTVIGNVIQKDNKYLIDTDEDAMIELKIDHDKLIVNIIKEPLAPKTDENFYWICERVG